MKKQILILIALLSVLTGSAKTLVVYYSFTNNVHTIVSDLQSQTDADVLRIEPAEEGLDYAANNYAIGSALIAAIRNHPNDASSYPDIKPVNVNLAEYDVIVVACPLWWNNMAAPMQTFLFRNGAQMAGKKIGLVVSSASSGISDVETDAHRLIPNGNFLTPSLWIRSSQTANCHTLTRSWLDKINYSGLSSGVKTAKADMPVNVIVNSDAICVKGKFDKLALYNLSGHKMLESSSSTIDTSSLVSGIYVAKITTKSRLVSKKIVAL